MYAAVFEMSSWMGLEKHILKGQTASDLLDEFENIQSLSCLVRMGKSQERGAARKALEKVEEILEKSYDGSLTPEELLTLDIKISLGTIKCVEILEGDDAFEKLKAAYPDAR